jgi:hypothetical protein
MIGCAYLVRNGLAEPSKACGWKLPGIKPEQDLEITIEDQSIHVRGQRPETEDVKGE